MKTKFCLATLTVLIATSTLAAPKVEIPNCWAESGKAVQDGGFLVGINAGGITGLQLAHVLDLATSQYTTVRNFPLVFDDYVTFLLQAEDYGSASNKPSRPELKKQVHAQLQKMIATGAVQDIECNGTDIGPFPGGTVHN